MKGYTPLTSLRDVRHVYGSVWSELAEELPRLLVAWSWVRGFRRRAVCRVRGHRWGPLLDHPFFGRRQRCERCIGTRSLPGTGWEMLPITNALRGIEWRWTGEGDPPPIH